jgi:hypothetical protein
LHFFWFDRRGATDQPPVSHLNDDLIIRPQYRPAAAGVRAMDERRKTNRPRSLLGARIVYNNRSSTLDCMVRNLSNTGARLVFSGPVAVPEEFELVIPQKGQTHRCKIAWRESREFGVEFLGRDEKAPPSIEAAKRLKELEAEREKLRRRIAQLEGDY